MARKSNFTIECIKQFKKQHPRVTPTFGLLLNELKAGRITGYPEDKKESNE